MDDKSAKTRPNDGRYAAIASVLGAVLASSCCVVPLVFVTLGVSGAWISNLSTFDPYKGYLAAITLVFLGAGFWQVYWRKEATCKDGSCCASPNSSRIVKIALWLAAVLVLSALTINWWAPLLY